MEQFNVCRETENTGSVKEDINSIKREGPFPEPMSISILTASLNEVQNIEFWLKGISEIYVENKLKFIREIIIVDDGSIDGTVQKVLAIMENYPIKIKLIQRDRKMGTLNAQIFGASFCDSDYLLIMDCDLQHPIKFIPKLIEQLEKKPDIVIGSRYTEGGINKWNPFRGLVSRVATFIAHIMIKQSRNVSDPLSGYFVVKSPLIRGLIPYEGMYKPLLYIISMHEKLKVFEFPVSMEERLSGESKIVQNPLKTIIRYLREVLVFWINSRKRHSKRFDGDQS